MRRWTGREPAGRLVTWEGFRFGMLLQLAIGPVCLFIFDKAVTKGFLQAQSGVLAVTLVDALYVSFAVFGISGLAGRPGAADAMRTAGAAVLFGFGFAMAAEPLGWRLLPAVHLFGKAGGGDAAFLSGFLLTASNPLTVVFWSGVFSAKVAGERMGRGQVLRFALGAVLATLSFLTLVACAGSAVGSFLPPAVPRILNVLVGGWLMADAVRRISVLEGSCSTTR